LIHLKANSSAETARSGFELFGSGGGSFVNSIQSGETSFSTNIQDINISPVELSRSVVFMSFSTTYSLTSNVFRGLPIPALISPDTLRFSRYSADGTITASWAVVEFLNGVNVQHLAGTVSGSPPYDISISPVDLTKTFLITYCYGGTQATAASSIGRATLLDNSTVRIVRESFSGELNYSIYVVEFFVYGGNSGDCYGLFE